MPWAQPKRKKKKKRKEDSCGVVATRNDLAFKLDRLEFPSCLSRNESDEHPWGRGFNSWPCPVGWGSSVAVSCGVGGRRGLELVLMWLWCKPAATAPIWSLAWEPPYTAGAALKRPKQKTKNKKKKNKKNKRQMRSKKTKEAGNVCFEFSIERSVCSLVTKVWTAATGWGGGWGWGGPRAEVLSAGASP